MISECFGDLDRQISQDTGCAGQAETGLALGFGQQEELVAGQRAERAG